MSSKTWRRLRFGFLSLAVALVILPSIVLGPYALRVRRFPADPAAGYYADFYLYVSPVARRAARSTPMTVLVQPNNSGTNSDDPAVHRRDAWWTGFARHRLADELGVALLVPAFLRPAGDWRIYTHAVMPRPFTGRAGRTRAFSWSMGSDMTASGCSPTRRSSSVAC